MKDGESRGDDEIAVFRVLDDGLRQLPAATTPLQSEQLTDLVMLLHAWAERINLTAHRTPTRIAERLVLDAAALGAAVPELRTAGTLVDLGSGAGFPGLPLAILHPHLEVRLIESRQKRHHFQREVRRRLALSNVLPNLGRSDRVEIFPSDLVVAQAMTQPEEALRLMLPWTREGGLMILPASEVAEIPDWPDHDLPIEPREYRVPGSGIRRRLWLVRRPAE